MESNLDKIAIDLYGKIRTRFADIKIGDENAQVLTNKEDIPRARFFEFEFTEHGVSLGTLAITLDVEDGLIIYVSNDLVKKADKITRDHAYQFIRSFRNFAKTRLLKFDVQNIGKSNLDKQDYQFQAKRKDLPAMPQLTETTMYGTNKVSYQDLGEARLIIKHKEPLNMEENAPVRRSLHIGSIYIENAQGERFLYPFTHLNGARALAEHINHGGTPYDNIGKHITNLSEELKCLQRYKSYVNRDNQLSEAMGYVTEKVVTRINEIKKTIKDLQRPPKYEAFAEAFEEQAPREIPEAIMRDWINRLTVRTFKEDITSVFPYLYNIIDETDIPIKTVTPDDIMAVETIQPISHRASADTPNPELEIESFIEHLAVLPSERIAAENILHHKFGRHPRRSHALSRLYSTIAKAKARGATLETQLPINGETKSIADIIRECGFSVEECGFSSNDTAPDDTTIVREILEQVSGFWNESEQNFTRGGTGVKEMIEKQFKHGGFPPYVTQEHIETAMAVVEELDPSTPVDANVQMDTAIEINEHATDSLARMMHIVRSITPGE